MDRYSVEVQEKLRVVPPPREEPAAEKPSHPNAEIVEDLFAHPAWEIVLTEIARAAIAARKDFFDGDSTDPVAFAQRSLRMHVTIDVLRNIVTGIYRESNHKPPERLTTLLG